MSGSATAGRGLYGAANAVPMRNGPPVMTRPPSLTNSAAVSVQAGANLTAVGIRGYGRDPDTSCFLVEVRTGPAVAAGATGTVVVGLQNNALGAASFWAGASWATVTVTGSNASLNLNWTATEALRANASYVIQVEWRAST